jgi:multisubunit Na+/H+ antiporter MnhF subunit
MNLPVKYAISFPVTAVMGAVLLASLATTEGRTVHPVYGFPNAALHAFLAGAAALLVVPPNAAAALIANSYAGVNPLGFLALLAAASAIFCVLELALINRMVSPYGGPFSLSDWRTYAALAGNALLMIFAALIFGGTS